jgi:hypothetical protein
MTSPPDALAITVLAERERDLAVIIAELRRIRWQCLPGVADAWRGTARHAYDAALDTVVLTADSALVSLERAHELTSAALAQAASGV